MLTSITIRDQINTLDQDDKDDADEPEDIIDLQNVQQVGGFGNVYLGAAQKPCTFQVL